ncbi:ribbon-helix-helix protein, CopG family [Qipengyuania qiaonensis]|uniref:Ribbon-helix-helix domain-containing protein n=1 Tax=Qipengyuania qiaonensis TaxID=2867240 RepID=A0ABS7JBT7_9SPHN|nr:ribbon-helix-helix protein, CopG family [Qipengyuania qiaonensis]MBX7483148.1 ribbon-helix-helix domain-containing protein [Qipengyuania qiaonensis]
MKRILADLPDDDIKWLDRVAEEQGKSRAAILREAVSAYRGETTRDGIEKFFGIWTAQDDPDEVARP